MLENYKISHKSIIPPRQSMRNKLIVFWWQRVDAEMEQITKTPQNRWLMILKHMITRKLWLLNLLPRDSLAVAMNGPHLFKGWDASVCWFTLPGLFLHPKPRGLCFSSPLIVYFFLQFSKLFVLLEVICFLLISLSLCRLWISWRLRFGYY